MKRSDIIRNFALGQVGAAYVYGGTGRLCTPAYRREQMRQYPQYAPSITKCCPVLSGRQSDCHGCRYNGRKAFDCAQLTKKAASAAGIALPSGATSQWNADVWAEKGGIDRLPPTRMAFLFRQSADGKMQHVGIYLGNRMFVDARGHAYGVLHSPLSSYRFTHYAVLKDQEGEYTPSYPPQVLHPKPAPLVPGGDLSVVKGRPLIRRQDVKLLQQQLIALGYSVGIKGADGVYGYDTAEAVRRFQRDRGLLADGVVSAPLRDIILSQRPAPQYIVTIGPVSADKRDAILQAYPQARVEQIRKGSDPTP